MYDAWGVSLCVHSTHPQVWKPPCDVTLISRASVGCIQGWARRFWQHSVDHRGTPTSPGRVATILHHTHPDLASEIDPARSNRGLVTSGMVYEITDINLILRDLDEREKNGYTRTVVDVFDPHNLDGPPVSRAIMYVPPFTVSVSGTCTLTCSYGIL